MKRVGFVLFAIANWQLIYGAQSEHSTSPSRQFVVYGPDAKVRGAISGLAEQTKTNLLGLLRQHDDWIERVVDSLSETVYITIDVDGFDPAIMPATGTPEPGGLTWYEALALLRRVIDARRVVGCDVVELCPIPGNAAPNFMCAKLVYKILTYRFGNEAGRK